LKLTRLIASNVGIPVIASGGAGALEHLKDVLTEGMADAALIASITHYGTYSISEIKTYLHSQGIKVRLSW
jgi:cyclase